VRQVSHAHRRSRPHIDGLARSDYARYRQSASAWHRTGANITPLTTLSIFRVFPQGVRGGGIFSVSTAADAFQILPAFAAVRLGMFLPQLRRGTSLLVRLRLNPPMGLACRVVHRAVARRGRAAGTRRRAKAGGGGGSRTRVRKHVAEGLYMRVRSCWFAPGVRERQKPPGASSEGDSPVRVGTARPS